MNEKNTMDNFEKVEKLKERASVSYEEAKDALARADWDLLDAMVLLEREGRTTGPEKSTHTTGADYSAHFEAVEDKVRQEDENASERFSKSLSRFFRTIGKKLAENTLLMRRKNERVFEIPLWAALIIILLCWEWIFVVLIISLFFDCRYSFEGREKDENNNANEILNRATDMVENVKEEFRSGSAGQ